MIDSRNGSKAGLPSIVLRMESYCVARFVYHARSKTLNCPHFRPDTQHKQEGSSTGLRIGLCLTSFDRLT